MALPKIDLPTYKTYIPSSEEEIIFRPFTVKENKILLLAYESEDAEQIIDATKQIIRNCVLSDIDIEKLAIFDIEYLILQIRIRSISDIVELVLAPVETRNNNKNECNICNKERPYELDLTQVKVIFPEEHSNKIEITEDTGLVMMYPTFNSIQHFSQLGEKENIEMKEVIPMLAKCIKMIYTKDKIIDPKDEKQNDLYEWIESLPTDIFNKMMNFFERLPQLKHKLVVECPGCKETDEHDLEGLLSFFG